MQVVNRVQVVEPTHEEVQDVIDPFMVAETDATPIAKAEPTTVNFIRLKNLV